MKWFKGVRKGNIQAKRSKAKGRVRIGHRALRVETLESRTLLTVTLTYAAAGGALTLSEDTAGATPSIVISEPSPNVSQLKIDLGAGQFFAAGSSVGVTGLAYESAGAPASSQYATIDISSQKNITALTATLPGDNLTLGEIRDSVGGLDSITANAANITVAGINTASANTLAGAGDISLTASGNLTVNAGAIVEAGSGTIALSASGTLAIEAGSTVVSTAADGITFSGAPIDIDNSANPAVVGTPRPLNATPAATLGQAGGITLNAAPGLLEMATDSSGDLYVPNSAGDTVSEFAAGSTSVTKTLTGLTTPTAAAIDSLGNVYAANEGGTTVSEFSAGSTTSTATYTGLTGPDALAFDGVNDLFVYNYTQTSTGSVPVDVFPGGHTTLAVAIQTGNFGASGAGHGNAMLLDGSGNLFTTSYGQYNDGTNSYLNGALTVTSFTASTNNVYESQTFAPVALALDSTGNLYLADSANGDLAEFAPGTYTSASLNYIGFSGEPYALAFDAYGNLYVASATYDSTTSTWSGSQVTVFTPGNSFPVATLTGLDVPSALTFDDSGNLFVANAGNNTVSEFSPSSTVSVAAPTVTGVSPTSGGTKAGTSVTITGTNLDGTSAVMFGGTAGTITSESDTQIVATAPAGAGTVDVTVVTPGGTSATSVADNYTYFGPVFGSLSAPSIVYGTATTAISGTLSLAPDGESVTVTINGVNQPATVTGNAFTANFNTSTLTVGDSPYTITFSYAGDANYGPSSGTSSLTVTPATPTVESVNQVNITFGTELANGQLSGTAQATVGTGTVNVPGTFSYTTAGNTTLLGGNGQMEDVTFTPTDSTDFTTASSTVTVNVAPAAPILSVTPIPITYGTALANGQLSGTARWTVGGSTVTVSGTLAFAPSDLGMVPGGGNGQSEAVIFSPTDTTDYTTSTGTVTVNVARAAPTVVSVKPVNIPYGTLLANSQLSGTAQWTVGGNIVTVAGTFSYTSADGTLLTAGNGQTEAVTFTPSDTTDYRTSSSSVTVNVSKGTPVFGVSNLTIASGAASTTIAGTISLAANGESVSITVNGVKQPATISGGAFSSKFSTSALTIAGSPYSVSYSYAGDTNLNAVSTTSKLDVDGPPTVVTAAKATPSTVTGKTTSLSVLGGDKYGEAVLTYTWTATTVPSGAAAPTFSANGTNGSKNTIATFSKAGNYTFRATITNAAGLSVTSSVNVTVNQTFTSIAISPSSPTIYEDQSQQFTATAYDQFGVALATQPAIVWAVKSGVGTITTAGLYRSPTAAGGAVITATSGAISQSASITVLTSSPTIVTAASASPTVVTGKTTNLSVLAADEHGAANLIYTWTATTVPSGAAAPTFSVNKSNAARNTTVTFAAAGHYTFTATIGNALGLTATSSVNVTVNQTLTTFSISPTTAVVRAGTTQQFAALATDQFGAAMSPALTWTTTVGQISTSGLLTAPASASSGTVTVSTGGFSATAMVTVSVLSTVNAVYQISDPLQPGKTAVYIYGTGTSDSIMVNPAATAGYVTVAINGISKGTFNPTGRIIIHGAAGNETILVSPQVTIPAFIYGGTGNDTLSGGGGASVIVGGGGKNSIYGGAGRSILIAGSGASLLSGGTGDALLVAGTTGYTTNDTALLALLNEWNSGESYATRAADIEGATGDPSALNSGYYLNASTVHSNGAVNHLSASGLALYYQNARDIAAAKKVGAVTVAIS